MITGRCPLCRGTLYRDEDNLDRCLSCSRTPLVSSLTPIDPTPEEDYHRLLNICNRQPWNSHDDQVLLRKRKKGVAYKVIAELLGRTKQATQKRYQYLLGPIPIGRPNRWTPEEDAQLVALVKTGMKRKDIGARLGRSLRAVGNRAALIMEQYRDGGHRDHIN